MTQCRWNTDTCAAVYLHVLSCLWPLNISTTNYAISQQDPVSCEVRYSVYTFQKLGVFPNLISSYLFCIKSSSTI